MEIVLLMLCFAVIVDTRTESAKRKKVQPESMGKNTSQPLSVILQMERDLKGFRTDPERTLFGCVHGGMVMLGIIVIQLTYNVTFCVGLVTKLYLAVGLLL